MADSTGPTAEPPALTAIPTEGTPEEKDLYWYRNVYQGHRMPQLTIRAVLMGGVLGMLMAAANLYTTIKIGWAFGVAITACVMSFVIWNGLRAVLGVRPMSVLENNCMQSTASAAGYSTGATISTMFGALLLLAVPPDGKTAADIRSIDIQPIWVVVVFTLCTGLMGVFLAIPLKRQMINYEQLRFPSGVAAAETLRSLHSQSKDALRKAYALLGGMGVGILVGILNTGEGTLKFLDRVLDTLHVRLPEQIPHDGLMQVSGKQPAAFGFESSVLLIAAGVITRMRVCLSMFLGSCLLYFLVGPALVQADQRTPGTGWVMGPQGEYVWDPSTVVEGVRRSIDLGGGGTILRYTTWALWGGTALMVFASLTAVALQWKTIARAFSGLGRARGESIAEVAEMKNIEVPVRWMVLGMIPISIAMLFVQIVAFHISWYAGLIAIGLTFFLALVACRATGETDTTPVGAMGKVMQLVFAVLHPGKVEPNLASAGIAANSASSSADLLTDLKSGYLLGANPRKQFLAQFIGVFFGTMVIVPVWFLMIPTQAALDAYPAPATRQWEAVARVLTKGVDQLPDSAQLAILLGALVGVLLPIVEKFTPPARRKYLPSAMGLGLSWIIPFSSALGFFIGAILITLWERFGRRSSDFFAIAIASGLIAGESMVKAVIAMTATAIGLFSGP